MGKVKVPPNCDVTFGFEIVEKEPGRTLWTWTADERWENPVGVIQGGAIAAFADTVMASTVVTALAGKKATVFTAEAKVSYLRPVEAGSVLSGSGSIVQKGSRVAFAEAVITAEGGKTVAKASSTWIISPRE